YCVLFAAIHLHFLPVSRDEDGSKFNRFAKGRGITDSLPAVLPDQRADLVNIRLRNEAVLKFSEHQLPDNKKDWEAHRAQLKARLIEKAGITIDHKLPLDIRETGVI